MPLTLLFDLDDTLLDTNLEAFIPAYFQAITQYFEDRVTPNVMLHALIQGTQRMSESADPTRTLMEVFDEVFYPALGIPKVELIQDFERFYANEFPSLSVHTQQRPEAVSLIEWAQTCGFRIAIATDPLFPRQATQHRLRWAGFDPEQFELVSSYENFHFTKTHPEYYAEVLGQLGWPEGSVVMVGNDAQRDIVSAARLGLKTYLIDGEAGLESVGETGRGTLAELRPWLESRALSTLEPSYKSREAILSILRATPATLDTLTRGLSNQQWRHEPNRNDWALNEILCHLRDTELEIHQMQIDLMLEKTDAFIPRPDTTVWANEREYLHVDGTQALREFALARLANLERLDRIPDERWARRARHAIFGPTNFLEVLGFMADHDQMHVQQAWQTLKRL